MLGLSGDFEAWSDGAVIDRMETPPETTLPGLRLERSQPAAPSVEKITDRFMSCSARAPGSGSLSKTWYGLEPSGKRREYLWYVAFDIVVVRSRRKFMKRSVYVSGQGAGNSTPPKHLFFVAHVLM